MEEGRAVGAGGGAADMRGPGATVAGVAGDAKGEAAPVGLAPGLEARGLGRGGDGSDGRPAALSRNEGIPPALG
jgi:hypothetical protein